MSSIDDAVAPKRGRPRKFAGRSRAVTLTLPESVIDALAAIDKDLSRAVVRIAQPRIAEQPHPPAELSVFGGRAVIVVNRTRSLEDRTGVLLVPLSDGRALISFDEPLTVAQFELRIQDAVDDRKLGADDALVFREVGRILRDARRSSDVTLQQRNIIVLETRASTLRRLASRPGKKRKERIIA